MIKEILMQDTPRVDVEAANPFFTEKRSSMTLAKLLAESENGYRRIADFMPGLSAEQLSRKAFVPLFRDTSMGEYPALAALVGGMGEYHRDFHINHTREVPEALGVP
jgi:hypothetical protein